MDYEPPAVRRLGAMTERAVLIDYTNWEGERRTRRVLPLEKSLRFEATDYHKPAQWVFDAVDLERPGVLRTFALKDVHSWQAR